MSQTKNDVDLKRLSIASPVAAVAAIVVNTVLFFGAKGAGLPLMLEERTGEGLVQLPLVGVIISSAVPVVAATIVFALLVRFTKRPALVFTIVGAIFLLVSMGGPMNVPTDGASTRVVLALMHAGAGIPIIVALTRLTRPRGTATVVS